MISTAPTGGPAVDLSSVFDLRHLFDYPDPYPALAAARRHAHVACFEMLGHQVYAALSYDTVLQVLRDAEIFSSRGNSPVEQFMGRTIVVMDGEEHLRMRSLVQTPFLRGAVDRIAPLIHRLAHELVGRVVSTGRVDLVSDLAMRFPVQVIARILGVPPEDHPRFLEWSLGVVGFAQNPGRGIDAAEALRAYLLPIVAARRARPRDDLISGLSAARIDDRTLSDDEVVNFLRLLIPAGAETTSRLIGNVLFALIEAPEQYRRVQRDRTLVRWAIEETLRWESPVPFVARKTTQRVEVGGVWIPAGSYVLAITGAANRDEARYREPTRFDLDRRAEDHLSFSTGRHFCLGSYLARLEARVVLDAVLDRIRNPWFDPSVPPPAIVGLAFRSPHHLCVRFDA